MKDTDFSNQSSNKSSPSQQFRCLVLVLPKSHLQTLRSSLKKTQTNQPKLNLPHASSPRHSHFCIAVFLLLRGFSAFSCPHCFHRRCCTTTALSWRTTMPLLPGTFSCRGQSTTSWSTLTTWSSSISASLSLRQFWLLT